MKKTFLTIVSLLCFVMLDILSANASTVGSVNDYMERIEFYKMVETSQSAPVSETDAGEERINTSNGNMAFKKTDLHLPGKGGHDLNVTRVFNTAQNTDADGISRRYYLRSSGEGESIKYAFKYYLNGDATQTPLYIIYDSPYDMLESENGTNSIYLSADYAELLTDIGAVYQDDDERWYYWGIIEDAGTGITFDSDVLVYEDMQSGNLQFCRDLTVGFAEVSVTSAVSYSYKMRARKNIDGYIDLGWEYEIPVLQSTDVVSVTTSLNHAVTGVFYDPEWGYALDIYARYRYDYSKGGPEQFRANTLLSHLYDPVYNNGADPVEDRIEESELYDVRYDMFDEDGERVDKITITRKDGKKFVFTDYEILHSITDAWGNTIYYNYDYPNKTITITDTLNRTVILSPNGISVDGETTATYEKTVNNNADADPNGLLDADNTYEFKVTYPVDSTFSKSVTYNIAPHGRRIVLAEKGSGKNSCYNKHTQTLDGDKLLLTSIELNNGSRLCYVYDNITRCSDFNNNDKPITEPFVIERHMTSSLGTEKEYRVNYTYTGGEDGDADTFCETVYAGNAAYIIKDFYDGDGLLYKKESTDTENGKTVTEEYVKTLTVEGNYLDTSKTVTQANGNNTATYTEEYTYDAIQKPSSITRDGVLIYEAAYSAYGVLETERNKREDDLWTGVSNSTTMNKISQINHCSYTPTGTNGKLEIDDSQTTATYTYTANGDLATEVIDGTTTEYTYSYADYAQSDASENHLTVTRTVKDAEIVNDAGEVVTSDVTSVSKYDYYGNLVEEISPKGQITNSTYDRLSRPLTISYPDNTTESYSYDDILNTVTHVNRRGRTELIRFDAFGRNYDVLYKNMDSSSFETLYTKEYTNAGLVSSYTVYEGNTPYAKMQYTYFPDNSIKTEKAYDMRNSNALLADKSYTHNTVTADGELVSSAEIAQTADKKLLVKSYVNLQGHQLRDTLQEASSTDLLTRTYTTDLLGNILTAEGYGGEETYTYDFKNRVSLDETGYNREITYQYDVFDHVIKATEATSRYTSYAYNKLGLESYTKEQQSSSKSVKTYKYYDANGNLRLVKTAKDTTPTYHITEYLYDANDNMIAEVRHSDDNTVNVTKYTYDQYGSVTSMATGLTSVDEAVNPQVHHVTTYTYDVNGNLISETDPMGNTKTTAYNTLDMPVSTLLRSGKTITYTYDGLMRPVTTASGNEFVTYTYDLAGNITQMVDTAGSTGYTYDIYNQLLAQSRGSASLSYSYNNEGDIATSALTYGSAYANTTQYSYRSKGILQNVKSNDNTVRKVYNYNDYDRIASTTTYNDSTRILRGTYTYTARNFPTQLQYRDEIQETFYKTYNLDGDISQHKESTSSRTANYTYNGLRQLASETKNSETTSYTYDSFGNIEQLSDDDKTVSYITDKNNRIVSRTVVTSDNTTETTTYTYDDDGNLISKVTPQGTVTYTYNNLGTLASVSDATSGTTSYYTYDGNRLRISKRVVTSDSDVTTEFINDSGGRVIGEVKNGNVTEYVWGSELVAKIDDGDNYFYVHNLLGDVVRIIKNSSSLSGRYQYDSFGNITENSIAVENPFRYRSEYTDDETRFIYLRNRYYDPETGRFISEDTHWNVNNMIYGDKEYIDNESRLPDLNAIVQSSNLYGYCMNNPINYQDTTGKSATATAILTTAPEWIPALVKATISVVSGIVAGNIIVEKSKSKSSDKEKANDIPSWAKGEKPKEGESGKDYARRLCDDKYGAGNYDTGPDSEYNKLKKYGDRGAKQ